MKKLFFLFISLFALVSCQNELYKDALGDFKSEQGAYVVNKGNLQIFIEENKDVVFKELKFGLVQKVDHEVAISLEVGSEAQLDAYNAKNGTSYVLLPKEMYELDSKLAFEPHYTSMVVPIQLKNVKFSVKGTYALPIKLTGGDVTAIGGQTEAFIIFEQRIVTKVLSLFEKGVEGNNLFPDDFMVPQWTMEVMVRRDDYVENNKGICGTKNASGSVKDEIFTRFGDVTIAANQLQIKTGGSQIDVAADKFAALAGSWYMLSFVYDGKNTMIYVNGALVAQREIRTGSYNVTGFWLHESNQYVREARFYKVARTAQQIASSVWKSVDYNDDNLLFYYPMNGKKYDRATNTIQDDETKIWDWSKTGKHMEMPKNAIFDNNKGIGFVFPPLAD